MSTAILNNKKKEMLVPQLRFKEFNDSWKFKKFSILLKEGRLGGNYENSESNFGIPVIKMGNLGRGEININKVQFLPKDIEYNKEDILKIGDLLFNTRNTLDLVGKVSVWREELPFALYNSNLMRMKFNHEIEQTNLFMNYNFNTKKSINQLRRFATGTTSVAAIYGKDLKAFNVTFPTLPEQQKIASFLSAVDEKTHLLSRKKELLEQYKKGVMQQLFSGKLRFKDENGEDYPDWEKKKLGEVLTLTIREVDKPKENYLAIGIRSHVKGTFQKPDSDPSKIAMDKLFVVKENDLIVNITFAWEGAIAIVKKEDDGGLVSHRFPTYTFNSSHLLREYFAQVIIDKKFRMILDLISPGGAGRNRVLSKKEFIKIEWSLPRVQEQHKISNFLSSIDTKIESTNKQIIQARTFKKGLLQQMFP